MASNAEIVNAWFEQRMRAAPLSWNTDAYNQVAAAIPELIAKLDANAAPAKPAKTPKAAAAAPADPPGAATPPADPAA